MTEEAVSLSGMSVAIGMPTKNNVPPETVMSLTTTVHRCALMGMKVVLHMDAGTCVTWGRDGIVDAFLEDTCTKLFWIDSDMVWTPEDFFRMLALSTKVDVVCAPYLAKVEGPPRYYVNYEPGKRNIGPNELVEILGTGLGFTVVDRSVIERLAAKAPKLINDISGKTTHEIFRNDSIDGHRRGEDMAFFADIRELGYKVWLDTTISLGHIGVRQWRAEA